MKATEFKQFGETIGGEASSNPRIALARFEFAAQRACLATFLAQLKP